MPTETDATRRDGVAMKKATTNYWVDMVTGVAFLFCAVTGLIRLFPEATVSVSGAGQPVILGISMSVWQTVHDWSGAVMAAGVGVHTALHFKWLVAMTGKMVRGRRGRERGRVGAPQTALQTAAPTPPAPRRAAPSAAPVAATQIGAAESLARLESMGRGRDENRDSQRRYTRKGFLAAAGVVGAAALVTGWSVLGRDAESPATSSATASSDGSANASVDSTSGYAESDGYGSATAPSASDGAGTSSGATTPTSSARVVIDADACTGCGNCTQVCPYGVFTMSGGKAVVQNADACRLCGHCLQTCAPGAITLNA